MTQNSCQQGRSCKEGVFFSSLPKIPETTCATKFREVKWKLPTSNTTYKKWWKNPTFLDVFQRPKDCGRFCASHCRSGTAAAVFARAYALAGGGDGIFYGRDGFGIDLTFEGTKFHHR